MVELSSPVGECCCCFDLKTGALILGYIDLAISVFLVICGLSYPVSYSFLIICGFGAINFAFVYGIHRNKTKYMLANIIWSQAIAYIGIGILIFSLIGIFAFSNWMMALIPQMGPYHNVTGGIIGIFLAIWGILALLTFLVLYFAKVKLSLYRAMHLSNDRSAAATPFQAGGMSTVNIG